MVVEKLPLTKAKSPFDMLNPSRTQTVYTKVGRPSRGSLTLGKRWSESYTAPRRAIGQGGTYLGTMCPYLTTVVCRPVWAAMPSRATW
jgi:hypothetical protein